MTPRVKPPADLTPHEVLEIESRGWRLGALLPGNGVAWFRGCTVTGEDGIARPIVLPRLYNGE